MCNFLNLMVAQSRVRPVLTIHSLVYDSENDNCSLLGFWLVNTSYSDLHCRRYWVKNQQRRDFRRSNNWNTFMFANICGHQWSHTSMENIQFPIIVLY